MTRRPTPSELMWPEDPADFEFPIEWAASVTTQVLDWTWRAFDSLRANHLLRIDLTQALEQVERDLARVRPEMSCCSSFCDAIARRGR